MSFQRKRKILTVISFFILFLFPLLFQQEADAAKRKSKTEKAAEHGDAEAQYKLAETYQYGWDGVKRNEQKYRKWIGKAAENGHDKAQISLGLFYQYHTKRAGHYKKAVHWYRKAAEQGNAEGQYILGEMYRDGKGVGKEYSEAAKWFRKSAEQGNAQGQKHLAMMYIDGNGVGQDAVAGERLYRKAAEQGYARTQFELGLLYDQGNGIRRNYCEAMRWYKKSGAQSNYDGAAEAREALPIVYAKIAENGLSIHCNIKEFVGKTSPEVDKLVNKAIKGYRAGLEDMGKEFFMKAVKTDPLFLYSNNTWYKIHQNQLPLSLAGEILLAVKPEKEESAGFWFDYAHTANLAAQPALARSAVKKLEQINGNMTDEKKKKEIQNVTAILKANAYIQMGRDKDAYAALLENGELDKEDFAVVNYINYWAKPLLKDKKKLSLLTGIAISKFTGKYAIPKPQAFHNIETGRLMTPAAPPKLVTKPKTVKPEPTPQPALETAQPDVTILD